MDSMNQDSNDTTGVYIKQDTLNLLSNMEEYPKTVYETFIKAKNEGGHINFLGTRNSSGQYEFLTYSEVYEKVLNFSLGLKQLIIENNLYQSKTILPIGIFASNCKEWTIADLSFTFQSLTCVGIYNTLDNLNLEYVINHSDIEILIISQINLLKLLKNNINISKVKILICIGNLDGNLKSWCENKLCKVIEFEQIERIGEKSNISINPAKEDTIYTICYTSGSTGFPKGVISTHENYVCSLPNAEELIKTEKYQKVYFSFLPLAHCFERSAFITIIAHNVTVGYFSGDIRNFFSDIQALKPTTLNAVPTILTRIYTQISNILEQDNISSRILRKVIDYKLNNLKINNQVESAFDDLVLSKFKQSIGGNVKLLGVGSAPMDKDALDILKVCLCVNIKQGYGSTETGGFISSTDKKDTYSGSVGRPGLRIQVKLKSVPSMKYLISDKPYPRGEILIKGPNVFKGYYKDDKATKQCFSEDGWYLTDDIGTIDENNRIYILDRKSNIFKMSNGEFIAPERIENIIKQFQLVDQCFIYGNPNKNYLVLMVIPDQQILISHFNQQKDIEILCKDVTVINKTLNLIQDHCKKYQLKAFEIPNRMMFHLTPFSVQGGELTDSFKMKRKVILNKYQPILEAMYNN